MTNEELNTINLELIAKNDYNGLLMANKRYIEAIANRFYQDEHMVKDLEQQGNIGLWEAMKAFNPDKGKHFIGFAKFYIRKYMTEFLTNNGRTIRIPANVYHSIKNGDFTPVSMVSLSMPNEDNSSTIEETISTLDEEKPNYSYLYEAINNITNERDKFILNSYFGINTEQLNLKQLGTIYNISRENVRLIIKKYINRFKKNDNLKSIIR